MRERNSDVEMIILPSSLYKFIILGNTEVDRVTLFFSLHISVLSSVCNKCSTFLLFVSVCVFF